MIWRKAVDLPQLNASAHGTMLAPLGIEITAIGEDYLEGTMPVDERTHQPMGLLHGGASVALAETVGSMAANLCAEEGHFCLGLEINANHVRSKSRGKVTARAMPVHIGSSTHIWQIDIRDEAERLVCVSRLTLVVLGPRQGGVGSLDRDARS